MKLLEGNGSRELGQARLGTNLHSCISATSFLPSASPLMFTPPSSCCEYHSSPVSGSPQVPPHFLASHAGHALASWHHAHVLWVYWQSQAMKPYFRKVAWVRPKATRGESREIFLVGQDYRARITKR